MTENELKEIVAASVAAEVNKIRRKRLALWVSASAFVPLSLWAVNIVKPYTFNDGDTLSAAKLNENFDKLYSKVNDIDDTVGYDAANGGYYFANMNGVKTKVYVKYLTGSLTNSPPTNIPHGVADWHKILSVSVMFKEGALYRINELYYGSIASVIVSNFDTTNIQITSYNATWYNENYRIKIEYTQ